MIKFDYLKNTTFSQMIKLGRNIKSYMLLKVITLI